VKPHFISEREDTRALWNRVADDWRLQVGDDGDGNRVLNSDPVLWAFAGDVNGLRVLDAGCGTGYLSKKLRDQGALVIGIDFSERMIAIARRLYPELDFRVEDCAELRTIDDEHCDLVIANYVLMDTPDLRGTTRAFNRVLKPDGVAVLVFSHPCFPQDRAIVSEDGEEISYRWGFPYFESRTCIEPPWAHFTSEFISFHRPLSDYLEGLHDGRVCRHGVCGAQGDGRPITSCKDCTRAHEQPDPSLFGGLQTAEEASGDTVTCAVDA
jgi:SAM-dependent methyltransferase